MSNLKGIYLFRSLLNENRDPRIPASQIAGLHDGRNPGMCLFLGGRLKYSAGFCGEVEVY